MGPRNFEELARLAVTTGIDAALRHGGAIADAADRGRQHGLLAAQVFVDAIGRANPCDEVRVERGDYTRASGDVTCGVCELEYRQHPIVGGFPWLHRICTGRLVKL